VNQNGNSLKKICIPPKTKNRAQEGKGEEKSIANFLEAIPPIFQKWVQKVFKQRKTFIEREGRGGKKNSMQLTSSALLRIENPRSDISEERGRGRSNNHIRKTPSNSGKRLTKTDWRKKGD